MEPWLRFRLRFVLVVSCAVSDILDSDAPADEKDLVIIGGGVAGYVAAIKAGQEGMKVRSTRSSLTHLLLSSTATDSPWCIGHLH